jgi:hypothetical protein
MPSIFDTPLAAVFQAFKLKSSGPVRLGHIIHSCFKNSAGFTLAALTV